MDNDLDKFWAIERTIRGNEPVPHDLIEDAIRLMKAGVTKREFSKRKKLGKWQDCYCKVGELVGSKGVTKEKAMKDIAKKMDVSVKTLERNYHFNGESMEKPYKDGLIYGKLMGVLEIKE